MHIIKILGVAIGIAFAASACSSQKTGTAANTSKQGPPSNAAQSGGSSRTGTAANTPKQAPASNAAPSAAQSAAQSGGNRRTSVAANAQQESRSSNAAASGGGTQQSSQTTRSAANTQKVNRNQNGYRRPSARHPSNRRLYGFKPSYRCRIVRVGRRRWRRCR